MAATLLIVIFVNPKFFQYKIRIKIDATVLMVYCGMQGSACAEPKNPWVPGGTHPNFKNMGSGGIWVQASWAKVGFGGCRVPGGNPEKWVPGKLGQTGFGHSIEERNFETDILKIMTDRTCNT